MVILLAIHSQMLKGILEGCILAIILQGETYGYELSVKLSRYGFSFVSEGSIYPLLQRMQRDQLIEGEMRKSPSGPMRKYYSITSEGERELKEFRLRWRDVQEAVENILQGEGQHDD